MTTSTKRLEPEPTRDYCSRLGAEALAGAIRAWWSAWGYPDLAVWTELLVGARAGCWVVRSKLVGGLPPGTGADQ